MGDSNRPNPDELLKMVVAEDRKKTGAQLRIYFGMSAGVGKTYAMLTAAHEAARDGQDVVVGFVETHGRAETEALLEGLEVLPRQKISYRGTDLEELDLKAVLERRPQVVIVDELPHTNAPGSLHSKRYQDILEILDAGIDVYTAVNVQHIESRKEAVEKITGIHVRETVPDLMIERANQIIFIDITPAGLLKRLTEGKVYLEDRAEKAAQNFFKEAPLSALRELALRLTAEKVDYDLQDYGRLHATEGPWNTNDRLMVAVSHSPTSERLIRATRRFAFNLEAPWLAVYIDTGVALSVEDQNQLSKNLHLARTLGAEVVTVSGFDISESLRQLARQRHVTQLILGRPTQRFVKDHFEGGTVLDRLVRESGEFDVHVIRQEGPEKTSGSVWKFLEGPFQSVQYWYVLWTMITVTVLLHFIAGSVGYRAIGFIYLPVILGIGMVWSLGPLMVAATLSVFLWNYFFIPPRFTLAISAPEDFMMCLSYFIVAITTGYLTHRIRRHEKIFQEREERTQILYQITKDIAAGGASDLYLGKVAGYLAVVLKGSCGFLKPTPQNPVDFEMLSEDGLALSEKEKAVALWALQNQKPAGWSTDNLPSSKYFYLPVSASGQSFGILVFRSRKTKRLTLEQENLLLTVAQQLAVSLEKEFLALQSKDAERLKESEKLHQALMNSVSHELRTPLTTLMGSATALADPQVADPKLRQELVDEVMIAGQRLNRVIENLLDMARLNSGVLTLKKDWYDLKELVQGIFRRHQKDLLDRKVHWSMGDLPAVKMDYRLIDHVFSNLVLNALAYTPKGTDFFVEAKADNSTVTLTFRDQGPGIPPEHLEKVFEKFFRVPGTKAGGTGLGLSISKSLIEAHGGTLSVHNHPEGGAVFTIKLPVEKTPNVNP